MANHHHFAAIQLCKSRDDGSIIPETSVSMQFHELIEHQREALKD